MSTLPRARKPRDTATGTFRSGYTDAERKAAIDLAVAEGLPTARRVTGIPKATIHSWVVRSGLELPEPTPVLVEANAKQAAMTQLRRAELREDLLAKAQELLDRMDDKHVEFKGSGPTEVTYPKATAGAIKDYAIAVGILIDKYRLEVGEAVGRTESRQWTDAFDDSEKRKLRDFIDGLDEGTGDPARSGDAQGAEG